MKYIDVAKRNTKVKNQRSKLNSYFRNLAIVSAVMLVVQLVGPGVVNAVETLPKNAQLSQWETNPAGGWITGELGTNNSDYAEGEVVPFSLDLGSDKIIVGTQYQFSICRDYEDGTKKGYLSLDVYNTSRSASAGGTVTSSSGPISGVNVSIDSVTEVGAQGVCNAGERETIVLITKNSSTAFVLWGGHLAAPSDPGVGAGNGASAYSGGSLHMGLFSPNMDRSIKPSAIIPLPAGTITLDKVTDPTGDPTSFSFATTNLPTPTSPSLTDAASPISWSGLLAGTYTIAETVPSEWNLTSANCSGGILSSVTPITNGVSITLASDENLTCTFTNTFNAPTTGTIELNKIWSGTAGQTTLNIGTSVGGSDVASTQTGSNGSGPLTTGTNTVNTGIYYVSEAGGLTNYDSALACTDDDQPVTPGTNNSVEVIDGHAVVCTFTNTYNPPSEPSADIAITKMVNNSAPHEDDTITYTVTVTNGGPDDAVGVKVDDALPPELTYVSDNSGGAYTSGVWTIGNLAKTASTTLTILATVKAGTADTSITNTAAVSASTNDPNAANNTASSTLRVTTVPGPNQFTLTLTKSGDGNGTISGQVGSATSTIFCELNQCNPQQEPFTQTYDEGTVVTLTAIHDDNSNFDSTWTSGPCIGSSNPVCSITMTTDWSVNAHFALNSTPPPVCVTNCGGGGGGGGGGGSPVTGTIAGVVFNDANSNGVQDSGEQGLQGWVVYLDTNNNGVQDSGEPSALTNPDGSYIFVSLAGTYTVRQVAQTGWSQTTPDGSSGSYVVTVNNQTVTGKNFGDKQGQVLGAITQAPQPQVAGATTLPRTGQDMTYLLLLGAGAAMVLGLDARQKRKKARV